MKTPRGANLVYTLMSRSKWGLQRNNETLEVEALHNAENPQDQAQDSMSIPWGCVSTLASRERDFTLRGRGMGFQTAHLAFTWNVG